MKNWVVLLCIGFLPLFAAGEEIAENTALIQTGGKSSLSSVKSENKLHNAVFYKSILSYALPSEIETVAQKCSDDPDVCYFSLKTFENASNTRVAAQTNIELAVLSLQRGQGKQALSHIEKACALESDNAFAQLTKGWILLSLGKYKKARQAFEQLLFLTADFEYVSSSKLGTALAWYFGGNKTEAATVLQYLYTSNPYTISFVSYMLGRISAEMKEARRLSPVFLKQSLSHDEKNYAAAELVARLAAKEKDSLHAWQYYATLYSLDPQNKQLAKKVEKYAEDLNGKERDYLFYLRLEQPIVHELASVPSEAVRMALYANREQVPQHLQSASVTGSGTASVTDERLGEILQIPAYIEKTIVFNPQNHSVDVKNSRGQVEFSAVRPFKIMLEQDRKTLLVSKIEASSVFAADLSDKELKGNLLIFPQTDGFVLINEVRSEDLIPALLATKAQEVTESAALEALAVVLRSALLQAVAQRKDSRYHITDNDDVFVFRGINLVFKSLLEAAQNSNQIRLTQSFADAYESCGTVTADSVENTSKKPDYVYSPSNVSKYMLSNPPEDLFSRPQDPTQWSRIKWMYLFEGKEIAARVAYKQNIGKLRALIPTKLSPNGRVLAMRFEGSKGAYEATTPQEVLFLLSAGTMRSNFFDIVPFYKGKNIERILVRGYDTGMGEGLCVRGADGLAKNGADYMAIIKYYFPQARILNTTTGMIN